MKCARCGTDSKYRDRLGGKCPKCKGTFAFEPQKGDPVTDGLFKAAIDAVSANGQVRWGVEHLYYEILRRQRRKSGGVAHIVATVVAFAVAGLFFLSKAPVPAAVFGALGLFWLVTLLMWKGGRFAKLDESKFSELWKRWVAAHGEPQGRIIRREKPAKAPAAVEPDLTDYSFDRAVICDRARTVDLLLANNFHFENNCAVLSVGGYPEGPFEAVRKMLKRNPRLQIFALHDCTPDGCKLPYKLTNEADWFKAQGRVIDVGLRPVHAGPFKGMLLPALSRLVEPGFGISEKEAAWLSEQQLQLAAIRPEQTLKRLYKAINKRAAMDVGDDGGSYSSSSSDSGGSSDGSWDTDDSAFSSDGGSDGGGDSGGDGGGSDSGVDGFG